MTKFESGSHVVKRPLLLSILAGLSILALSLGFIGSFFPTAMSLLRAQFSTVYLLLSLGMFPVGIAGSIGIWKMRRWGYYLYIAFTLIGYLINLIFDVNAGIGGYLFSLL